MKNNDTLRQMFDIPESASAHFAKIEIYSNRRAVVDGCLGVVDYSQNVINLNCGKQTVLFIGTQLEIVSYFDKGLILQGNIESIEFSGR